MKGVGVTRKYTVIAHICHVPSCPTAVPPRMLMCLHHWLMVPSVLKRAVWRLYVPGQETRKDPAGIPEGRQGRHRGRGENTGARGMSGRPKKVPFLPEFEERLLNGRKWATSRTKPIGKEGDLFQAFGQRFIITSIKRWSLEEIARYAYFAEGFTSASAFRNIWKTIHHRRGWSGSQMVYYHEFQRLPDKPAHPKRAA